MRTCIVCLLLVAAAPASAGTITYEFRGPISNIIGSPEGFGGVQYGDPLIARLTLDAGAPDLNEEPLQAEYLALSGEYHLPSETQYFTLAGVGVLFMIDPRGEFSGGGLKPARSLQMEYWPSQTTGLTSTDLPLSFPGIWTGYLLVTDEHTGTQAVAGIESYSITPEPTGALLFLGSVALCGHRRRSACSTMCV